MLEKDYKDTSFALNDLYKKDGLNPLYTTGKPVRRVLAEFATASGKKCVLAAGISGDTMVANIQLSAEEAAAKIGLYSGGKAIDDDALMADGTATYAGKTLAELAKQTGPSLCYDLVLEGAETAGLKVTLDLV